MKKTALFLAVLMIFSAFSSAGAIEISPVAVEDVAEIQTASLFEAATEPVVYDFANEVAGNADGVISLNGTGVADNCTDVTLYYANEEGKLQGFTKITSLTLDENGAASYTASGSRAFPKGATKIVAEFSGDGVDSVTYEYTIPENKRMPNEEPLYKFYASSDLHLGQGYGNGVPRYTADIVANKDNYDFIIMDGDLVNHGISEEYAQYSEWVENTIYANEIPYFMVNGNHEFHVKGPNGDAADGSHDLDVLHEIYDTNEAYLKDTFGIETEREENKLFYSAEYNGLKLIFLSSPSYLTPPQPYYSITEEQLEWLDAELYEGEKSNKPVFVICHVPADDLGTTPDSERNGDEQLNNADELNAILNKHPNLVLISAHTHQNFFLEDQVNMQAGDMKTTYSHFNDGSVHYVIENKKFAPYTLTTFVEVYKDKILVNGKQYTSEGVNEIAYRYYMISLPDADKTIADVTMSNTNPQIGDTVKALVDGEAPAQDAVCTWYVDGELVYTGAEYTIEKLDTMPGKRLSVRVEFADGTYASASSEGVFDFVEVKYDLNGANGTVPASQKVFAGETVTLYVNEYTPLNGDKYFLGWSTDKNTKAPVLEVVANEDVTVYPVFGDTPAFYFDSLAGWTTNGAFADAYIEDGILKYTSSETNGDIVFSRSSGVDADKYTYVRVKQTNTPDAMFFITDECGYDASKTRITFGKPVATVGDFSIYEADILSVPTSKEYWKGTVKRVRYDPFHKVNTYGETDYLVFSENKGIYGANVNVDENGVYITDGEKCYISNVVWTGYKITITLSPEAGYEFTTDEDIKALVTINGNAVERATVKDGKATVSYTFDEKPIVGTGAPEALDLATIRTDSEAQGIRFAACLRDDQREAAYEYGFIISIAEEFDSEDEYAQKLVFDGDESSECGTNSYGIKFVSGKAYLAEEPGAEPSIDKVFAKDGAVFGFEGREGIFITAVLKNIPKNRYFDTILCRPYIRTEEGIFYGNIVERSIRQVAESIVEKQYGGDVNAAPEYIRNIYNAKNEGRESFMNADSLYD